LCENIPPTAVSELAAVHNALGNVYRHAGRFGEAQRHFQEAIRYKDYLGDHYNAAQNRRNVAFSFAEAGRLSDALEYAQSAKEKFEACGPAGAEEVQKTQDLINWIEECIRSGENRTT